MKTALITGASTGIGKELAICHARKGGDLVVVARSEDKLLALKSKLESEEGICVDVVAKDLLQPNAAKELFATIQERKIRVDYLINNAGFGDNGLFKDSEFLVNQQMIQLNIIALTELCHCFVQNLIARSDRGKIMNVASTAAFQAVPYFSVYAATKAYVLSFSEALALELKKEGITVTALCPGPTRTEFAANAKMDPKLANHKLLPSGKDVAVYGYKKMLAGQTVAVHGAMNKMGAGSNKLFGRTIAARVAGSMMKKAGDSSI